MSSRELMINVRDLQNKRKKKKKVQKNKVINFCHNMFREMNNWKEIWIHKTMQLGKAKIK